MFDANDPKTWPARLTTSEVLALARFSQTTLWRRIKAGTMPKAIDSGREAIFDRDAVLKALGMVKDEAPAIDDGNWGVDGYKAFIDRKRAARGAGKIGRIR